MHFGQIRRTKTTLKYFSSSQISRNIITKCGNLRNSGTLLSVCGHRAEQLQYLLPTRVLAFNCFSTERRVQQQQDTPVLHTPLHLEKRGHDDHCAPQQLEVAHGREQEAYLGERRARKVKNRRNYQPPQHATGHLRCTILGRFESLVGYTQKKNRYATHNRARGLYIQWARPCLLTLGVAF